MLALMEQCVALPRPDHSSMCDLMPVSLSDLELNVGTTGFGKGNDGPTKLVCFIPHCPDEEAEIRQRAHQRCTVKGCPPLKPALSVSVCPRSLGYSRERTGQTPSIGSV